MNTIHRQLQNMLVNSLAVVGLFWGLDQKRNGTEPTRQTRRILGQNCRGHDDEFLRFRSSHISCPQCIEKGELRSKGGRKNSTHFNGSDEYIELHLRTVISANQLSVYGAIADLCNELSEDIRASGKLEAPDHLETMEIPTGHSVAENSYQRTATRKLGAIIRATIRTIVRKPDIIQIMF